MEEKKYTDEKDMDKVLEEIGGAGRDPDTWPIVYIRCVKCGKIHERRYDYVVYCPYCNAQIPVWQGGYVTGTVGEQ